MYPYYRSTPDKSKVINLMLARAYVPDQPYIGILPLDEALKKGVLFPNLDIPYAIKSKE
ncbi:spore coat associated protein CotJA [Fonticella tunisiensis]|uniref:Spore coat associated protein JA (CotJA) n=1 Tax=Fonticella tunisiensis TaxID=1096341 RepID=A0A4R7KT87_9CLOT|nr:spore coat associated protein CotJA [Fonticella tunisiensis]TDT63298.1 spore coat associated protein JA (CotJA) [Fonticella tunisiensis]